MKLIILFFISLFSFHVFSMSKIPLMSGKVYVPEGYDSNDLVEVTILGSLPDLCHRSPTYELRREGQAIKIYLYAYYVPQVDECRKISVPFQETINLGLLSEGSYTVELRGADVLHQEQLKVTRASSNLIDDFQYGNVMNIIENDHSRWIKLVGTNPTNCLSFDKLETQVQKNVIVLRPKFKELGHCEQSPSMFSIKYQVPFLSNHPKGVLLHVRVMGGRSFNYLYQNKL